MCGIAGILTFDAAAGQPEFASSVRSMANLMRRRGPDDEGFWSDPAGHLQLGFRRLSILDLSPAGHQPMVSPDGRFVIAFNGEIYNYQELRAELELKGIRFRSQSDTEVLLQALNVWGEEAIKRLNGMFAFAWYDLKNKTLILARDHAGIKPLYYFTAPGKGFAFSSQYNALFHTPWGQPGAMRLDVLHLYLRLHHVPAPYGLFANTYQLEPGHYLLMKAGEAPVKKAWWTLPSNPEPDLSGAQAAEALKNAVENAVRRQRISDVPLGVFLSGGVDSPLVTAVARRQTDARLKAFTISNSGWAQDESSDAKNYAKLLEVDHRLHVFDEHEIGDLLPEVMTAQHEPLADFSILPTLLVSRFAHKEVTVALSGDGGDELFFGYERPLSLLKNGEDFRWPHLVRMAFYGAGKYGLGAKKSDVIAARTPGDYYFDVNSRLKEPELQRIVPGLPGIPEDFSLYRFGEYKNQKDLADYSRRVEFYGQLQRVLKKVDMASMHCSLEVRVPLLDREVIETSLRIDPFDCMRGGGRKIVLRDLLAGYVPASVIPVPKRGFSVPLGQFLKGSFRPFVEDHLLNGDGDGFFDRKNLNAYWQEHLSGHADHKWGLWTLMSLNDWMRRQNS